MKSVLPLPQERELKTLVTALTTVMSEQTQDRRQARLLLELVSLCVRLSDRVGALERRGS